jgi:transcription termination/antitermination protein NusG
MDASATQNENVVDQATETPVNPIIENPNAKWYVVHTYSGHENKVEATLRQRIAMNHLQDKIVDIKVPTHDQVQIKEGKKSTIKEKIFPGYILVKMELNDDTWSLVRTTPGVTSFVGMGNKPTPLPEKEVQTIMKFMEVASPRYKVRFETGEAIKIIDGPFADFIGTVSEINDEKGKVTVLVSIFGRETPVELDFLQVAKL